jgi:hypothetical protein
MYIYMYIYIHISISIYADQFERITTAIVIVTFSTHKLHLRGVVWKLAPRVPRAPRAPGVREALGLPKA